MVSSILKITTVVSASCNLEWSAFAIASFKIDSSTVIIPSCV